MPAPPIREQLRKYINFLQGSQFNVNSPIFGKAIQFIHILNQHPAEFSFREVKDLRFAVQRAFQLSDTDLELALAGVSSEELPKDQLFTSQPALLEQELWQLVPTQGYLRDYCNFTRNHEAPLAYHLFSAIAGISAVANNKVWYHMGYYKLFPSLNLLFLGPSGLKKSTAVDVMADMLIKWNYCNVYAEKFTPEYFLQEIAKEPTGLLFIRELASVLTRQRYMEGTIAQLTRLMDHKTYQTGTKGEGKLIIRDPAPCFIACTTPESMTTQVTPEVFGGGFMARLVVISQEDSPRVEPSPGRDRFGNLTQIDFSLENKLQEHLGNVLNLKGEMSLSTEAYKCYDQWYREGKVLWRAPEVPLLATYYQRKHDHVKRVAMCLHLVDHQDMIICLDCFQRACKLLDWIEQFVAPVYKEMFKTSSGVDNELVLKTIRSHGGVISHSQLVRAIQYRMDASRLKIIIQSLKDAQVIEEKHDKFQHCYLITS